MKTLITTLATIRPHFRVVLPGMFEPSGFAHHTFRSYIEDDRPFCISFVTSTFRPRNDHLSFLC